MAAKLDALIAVNRCGLGAKPGELNLAKSDPHGWLIEQIKPTLPIPETIAALTSSSEILARYTTAQETEREMRVAQRNAPPDAAQAQKIIQNARQVLVPMYAEQVAARYRVASTSEQPFRERLIHFWTNHFAVSADKVAVLGIAGALENEAIRPNVGKRFVDMLLAVERHPAMILYLDNQLSMGPNSQLAQLASRRPNPNRKLGINENLAREIMELHTLGVNGGYTQTDVTTFAEALTGWSIGGIARGRLEGGEPGKFMFRSGVHEPGAKTILGKRYAQEGEAQARAVLEDLARHPATAKFIATKLVRHFVGDEPPAAAVEKVAKVFLRTEGDLSSVHRAIVELPELVKNPSPKFKSPHEFATSTFRALNDLPRQPNQIIGQFDLLGQRPFTPGSPAGWPDSASQWDGADALMKRIEWSATLSQRVGSRVTPLELADQVLGDSLGDHSRTAIARASSAPQGLALLLMSPEFQRR